MQKHLWFLIDWLIDCGFNFQRQIFHAFQQECSINLTVRPTHWLRFLMCNSPQVSMSSLVNIHYSDLEPPVTLSLKCCVLGREAATNNFKSMVNLSQRLKLHPTALHKCIKAVHSSWIPIQVFQLNNNRVIIILYNKLLHELTFPEINFTIIS